MVMFGNYGKLSDEARNYLDYTLKEFQCLNKLKGAKNMITYKEGLEIIQMIKDKYLLSFKASISLITITKEYCVYKIHAVVENKNIVIQFAVRQGIKPNLKAIANTLANDIMENYHEIIGD